MKNNLVFIAYFIVTLSPLFIHAQDGFRENDSRSEKRSTVTSKDGIKTTEEPQFLKTIGEKDAKLAIYLSNMTREIDDLQTEASSINLNHIYSRNFDEIQFLELHDSVEKLIKKFERAEHDININKTKYESALGSPTSDSSKKIEKLLTTTKTTVLILTDYKDKLTAYRISHIRKYKLQNRFRETLGWGWLAVVALMVIVIGHLIKNGDIKVGEGITLHLVSVVLIVFVVVYLTITEVISENGATGLLASLAGYILGKTTSVRDDEKIADIINASRIADKLSTHSDEQNDADNR